MKEEIKSGNDANKTTAMNLNKDFWDSRYINQTTGWDLGEVSPPLKGYIDQLTDKKLRILIPGCGNSYEAEYLLKNGFTDVTVVDIAPSPVNRLKAKFKNNPAIKILLSDFFEHHGKYDLILEQTFFCALNPALRMAYRDKMHSLLEKGGKLAGVLFNKEFEQEGPPFGGSKSSYEKLFKDYFEMETFETCTNSHPKRQDSELFMILKKK